MKHATNLLILFVAISAIACAHQRGQIVSRGGIVNISNQAGEQVELYVDGSRFVVVDPGQDVELDKIISGRRVVTARGVDSGLSRQREFDLVVNRPQSWRIDRFSAVDSSGRPVVTDGAIDVVNGLSVAVDVEIPGYPVRQVASGVTVRFGGIQPGLLHVVARVPGTDSAFAMDLNVRPGVVPAFAIAPPAGAVRIVNRSGRTAIVNTATHSPRMLDDGISAIFDGLPAGTAEISVVDMANRPLGGFRVETVPGKVLDLVVNRPAGILKVVSDLNNDVSIYSDGLLVGQCAASGGATIQGLVIGRNHLRAVDANGDTVATSWLEIGVEPALWLLTSGTGTSLRDGMGAIKVENPSREAVSVFIDGCEMGPIASTASRVYPDLPPGDHQVATIGAESHSFATATVTVAEGRTLAWKIALPGATLAVRNTSGDPANVYADGKHVGSVDPGVTGVFAVAEGPHRIDVSGGSGASSITRNMTLPAGATTSIVFSSQFVTVVATNLFSDPMEVRIDERILGVLNPGERVTVTDVRPGELRLIATSTIRPVSMTTTVSLDSGDAFDWLINP